MNLYYSTKRILSSTLITLLSVNFLLRASDSDHTTSETPCIPSYYQDKTKNTYYPMLDPTITIYGGQSNEKVKEAITKATENLKKGPNNLEENSKIVICSYFREKREGKSKSTFAENRILALREQQEILIVFNLIMSCNDRKFYPRRLISIDPFQKKLAANNVTVGIFKIEERFLYEKNYIGYFETLLEPDVLKYIKEDPLLGKKYQLKAGAKAAAKSYLSDTLEAFRQEYLYWDRIEDILYSKSLTQNSEIVLDLFTTTSKPKKIKFHIQFTKQNKNESKSRWFLSKISKGKNDVVSVEYKQDKKNNKHIIQVTGFKNKYNKSNRKQIVTGVRAKLEGSYRFDTKSNMKRYRKLYGLPSKKLAKKRENIEVKKSQDEDLSHRDTTSKKEIVKETPENYQRRFSILVDKGNTSYIVDKKKKSITPNAKTTNEGESKKFSLEKPENTITQETEKSMINKSDNSTIIQPKKYIIDQAEKSTISQTEDLNINEQESPIMDNNSTSINESDSDDSSDYSSMDESEVVTSQYSLLANKEVPKERNRITPIAILGIGSIFMGAFIKKSTTKTTKKKDQNN